MPTEKDPEQVDDPGWTDSDDDDDLFGGKADDDEDAEATGDGIAADLTAESSAQADAEALLELARTKDQGNSEADELFRRQLAEAERKSKDYQPPSPPLTAVEEAAVELAHRSRDDIQFLTDQLQDAADARARSARANQPGFDSDGDPVEVPEPYSPAGLDSASFGLFVEAVKAGGASPDPRRVPPNETYETWSAKVNSALAGGIER